VHQLIGLIVLNVSNAYMVLRQVLSAEITVFLERRRNEMSRLLPGAVLPLVWKVVSRVHFSLRKRHDIDFIKTGGMFPCPCLGQ
jgi:hypothetical protein